MKAEDIIRLLKLQPHPKEYGYFIETYRSPQKIADHSLSTAIYFLVTRDGMSEMHRLTSDEIFHYYLGAPAEVLLLDQNESVSRMVRLGPEIKNGELPQLVIPKGVWQGMRTTGDFTLIGCTVAPGFEYTDYESGRREQLIRQFPAHAQLIREFTR